MDIYVLHIEPYFALFGIKVSIAQASFSVVDNCMYLPKVSIANNLL